MRRWQFLIFLSLGVLLLALGLFSSGFIEVFKAGSLLCLSCMGLGL